MMASRDMHIKFPLGGIYLDTLFERYLEIFLHFSRLRGNISIYINFIYDTKQIKRRENVTSKLWLIILFDTDNYYSLNNF